MQMSGERYRFQRLERVAKVSPSFPVLLNSLIKRLPAIVSAPLPLNTAPAPHRASWSCCPGSPTFSWLPLLPLDAFFTDVKPYSVLILHPLPLFLPVSRILEPSALPGFPGSRMARSAQGYPGQKPCFHFTTHR